MRILRNKYFILGNLLLIMVTVPVTLFFIKKQTEVRSKAAPSTKLFFSPSSVNTQNTCSNFTLDVMADPGQNLVSIVNMYITFDATKMDLASITPSTSFEGVIRTATISNGNADISLTTGGNTTKAITSVTKVATLTFNIKQGAEGASQVKFDDTKTQVSSLAGTDEWSENVLSSTTPADVTLTSGVCSTGEASPSPTITTTTSPSPTATTSPTPTSTPTPSVANLPPSCTELSVSPGSSGSAPFSVSFTAKGVDSDGLISKATFNFGDGQVQDVTEGMNLQNVTVQLNHTFQTGGTFGTTVTFTDNGGTISQSCSQTIIASGAGATSTPTATPTVASGETPTIAPTGSISTTVGVIGAVILTVIGGILLLAL